MRFRIAGNIYDCSVANEGREVSPHTGNQLRLIEIEFVVYDKSVSDEIVGQLQRSKEIESLSGDSSGVKWKVDKNSVSHQVGSSRGYHHTITLTEREALVVEKLIIGDFEVVPYSYEESFSKDALMINAKIILSPDKIDQFRLLALTPGRYLDVVRKGLSDTPVRMRFGRVFDWSSSAGGTSVKQAFNLVDQKYDESGSPRFDLYNKQIDTLLQENIVLWHTIDAMAAKLTEAGILADEDISEPSKEEKFLKMYDYYEVPDIDEE